MTFCSKAHDCNRLRITSSADNTIKLSEFLNFFFKTMCVRNKEGICYRNVLLFDSNAQKVAI